MEAAQARVQERYRSVSAAGRCSGVTKAKPVRRGVGDQRTRIAEAGLAFPERGEHRIHAGILGARAAALATFRHLRPRLD